MMGWLALLCVASSLEAVAGSYVMTDSNIYAARDAWLATARAAERRRTATFRRGTHQG